MAACGTMEEIAAQHRPDEYRVRVRVQGEGASRALLAIDGVAQVTQLPARESGWEDLLVHAQQDIAEQIPPALFAAGVRLRMLCPVEAELEELFMKLMQEGG